MKCGRTKAHLELPGGELVPHLEVGRGARGGRHRSVALGVQGGAARCGALLCAGKGTLSLSKPFGVHLAKK
jgi:hypothetical protein